MSLSLEFNLNYYEGNYNVFLKNKKKQNQYIEKF